VGESRARGHGRAETLGEDVAPCPAYADGIVYAAIPHSKLFAIRTGGEGDVTKTHMAWSYDKEVPDVASPVTDGRLYMHATSGGFVVCLDAKTGKPLWSHKFAVPVPGSKGRHKRAESFWSSPTVVGELAYVTSQKGATYIFAFADEFVEKGKGELGEPVVSSPAFIDGRIYIRGKKHLFCLGKAGGGEPDG
jgi:outer membrane protein assembly factor BamB